MTPKEIKNLIKICQDRQKEYLKTPGPQILEYYNIENQIKKLRLKLEISQRRYSNVCS
jgi:hypothetical protein